jgi:hypothetical protein
VSARGTHDSRAEKGAAKKHSAVSIQPKQKAPLIAAPFKFKISVDPRSSAVRFLKISPAKDAKIAKRKPTPQISQMNADQESKPTHSTGSGQATDTKDRKEALSSQHSAKTKRRRKKAALSN